MEAKLTPAAKAIRRLSAGPRPKKSEHLGPLGAIARALQEMERVEAALRGVGLTGGAEDFQINLLYAVPGSPEHPDGFVGNKRCGPDPREFFEKVESVGSNARFLGLLTLIADHERGVKWPYVRPFLVDAESMETIAMFLAAARGGKLWIN